MKKNSEKRPVRIFNPKTGETRFSEPVAVHGPKPAPNIGQVASTENEKPIDTSNGPSPATLSADVETQNPDVPNQVQAEERDSGPPAGASRSIAPDTENTADRDSRAGKSTKTEIESLEQFIEYAYGRKGQKLVLPTRVQRKIGRNARLGEEVLARLYKVAESDLQLAVPRQLLLVSREVMGYPELRTELSRFVLNVMLRHPVFSAPDIQAALRNQPDALPAADILVKIASFNPADKPQVESKKGSDLLTLRRNAANLFAAWLSFSRGVSTEELAALLHQGLWLPAARELPDDTARIRVLTEIGDAAGVGLACLRFQQQAIDTRAQLEHAQRDAGNLREQLRQTESDLVQAEDQLLTLRQEFRTLQEQSEAHRAELKRSSEVEKTHLQHELEQLRGRLMRRLTDSIEMLEVGLSALRNRTPRVEVMAERAEHVVDALRAEKNNLREE